MCDAALWVPFKSLSRPAYHPVSCDVLESPVLEILKILLVLLGHLGRVLGALAVVLGVGVEALGVAGIAHRRDDGARAATVQDVVPVGTAEERVGFDAGCATADVAEAAGAVDGAEGADEVLGLFR